MDALGQLLQVWRAKAVTGTSSDLLSFTWCVLSNQAVPAHRFRYRNILQMPNYCGKL